MVVLVGVLIYSAATVDRAAKNVTAVEAVGDVDRGVDDVCLNSEECVYKTTNMSSSYQTDIDDDELL